MLKILFCTLNNFFCSWIEWTTQKIVNIVPRYWASIKLPAKIKRQFRSANSNSQPKLLPTTQWWPLRPPHRPLTENLWYWTGRDVLCFANIFSYQVFVILSYHYSEGDILLDVMIPNTKLTTIFPGFVIGGAKFKVGSQWRNIVLRWLISVELHSGGDKVPSILGSFSFVRLKFQSGVAFWRQNVRQVTSGYPSPAKVELTTWYNWKSQIPSDK